LFPKTLRNIVEKKNDVKRDAKKKDVIIIIKKS